MSLPWFPLYANDLSISTATMTPSALGSYIRLLCYAWNAGGIPNDYEVCARIANGMTPSEWNEIRLRFELISSPDSPIDKLVNPRMERERERTSAIRASRQDAAARTNAARWGKPVADRVGEQVGERSYLQSQSQSQNSNRGVLKKKHDAAEQLKRLERGDSNG
jgi:uncharacterized protein YdaU (DUF1376 family)